MPPRRREKSASLGELERAVMEVVWERGEPTTVPEVHAVLSRLRPLAYTTAMTVMNRLFEKRLLGRSEERRPYTYWAAVSREDYSADAGRPRRASGPGGRPFPPRRRSTP